MILITGSAGIIMAAITISASVSLNFILIRKWALVRKGETYIANKSFRILWYLFLVFGGMNSLGDFAELYYFISNSLVARALRYLGRNTFLYLFPLVLIQIVILVREIIDNIKDSKAKKPKFPSLIYFLYTILTILYVPVFIFAIRRFLPISDGAKKIIRVFVGFTDPSNGAINLILGVWLIILFRQLISIIKENEFLRETKRKKIRRWKIFLILIIISGLSYFLVGMLTLFSTFEIDVFGDISEEKVPEGQFELFNELIIYNILRFIASIIITFFSPYSYIRWIKHRTY